MSNTWASTSLTWAGFGVVAGAVFAALGSQAWVPGRRGIVAAAGAGSVCSAEGATDLLRIAGDSDSGPGAATFHAGLLRTSVLTALIGLIVLVVAAGAARAGQALLTAAPLTAAAVFAFHAAGF